MDFSSITGVSYNAANTSKASTAADRITNSANSLNSESSEEELKGVLKDFESYFVEQMRQEMKDTYLMGNKVYFDEKGIGEILKKEGLQALLVSPRKTEIFRSNTEMVDEIIEAGIKILMYGSEEWDGKTPVSHHQLQYL